MATDKRNNFKNYRFEDLEVYKLAMRIVHESYTLIRKFPKSELFSLGDQLKRAAISIVLNIAEGSGQPTKKGFQLYIQRAKSSALECVACLKIAVQEGFLSEKDVAAIESLLQEEYFKLIALNKSLNS